MIGRLGRRIAVCRCLFISLRGCRSVDLVGQHAVGDHHRRMMHGAAVDGRRLHERYVGEAHGVGGPVGMDDVQDLVFGTR